MSGVYLDQIAAAPPNLCMDRGHHHLPGGGSWWIEQYNLMLRRCRQIKGTEGLLITESNAEVYLQSLDGMLTWVWMLDDLVPAFPTLYSGYVIMLGRSCNGIKKRDVPFFKFHVAQQLLFGQQIGWINTDVAEDAQKLPFLKRMVGLRCRYAEFFYRGELLRPAVVNSSLPDRYTTPSIWETRPFEICMVQAAVWRLWDSSRTVLFIVNIGDQKAVFNVYSAGCGNARLLEGNGGLDAICQEGTGLRLQGWVAPGDAIVVELSDSAARP